MEDPPHQQPVMHAQQLASQHMQGEQAPPTLASIEQLHAAAIGLQATGGSLRPHMTTVQGYPTQQLLPAQLPPALHSAPAFGFDGSRQLQHSNGITPRSGVATDQQLPSANRATQLPQQAARSAVQQQAAAAAPPGGHPTCSTADPHCANGAMWLPPAATVKEATAAAMATGSSSMPPPPPKAQLVSRTVTTLTAAPAAAATCANAQQCLVADKLHVTSHGQQASSMLAAAAAGAAVSAAAAAAAASSAQHVQLHQLHSMTNLQQPSLQLQILGSSTAQAPAPYNTAPNTAQHTTAGHHAVGLAAVPNGSLPSAAQPYSRLPPTGSLSSSAKAAASGVDQTRRRSAQGNTSKAARRLDALFAPAAALITPSSMQGLPGAAAIAGLAGKTMAEHLTAELSLAGFGAAAVGARALGVGQASLTATGADPRVAAPAAAGAPQPPQRFVQLRGPFALDSDATAFLDQLLSAGDNSLPLPCSSRSKHTAPADPDSARATLHTEDTVRSAGSASAGKPVGHAGLTGARGAGLCTAHVSLQEQQQQLQQAALSHWEAASGASTVEDKISIYEVPEALWLLDPSDMVVAAASMAAAEAEVAALAAAAAAAGASAAPADIAATAAVASSALGPAARNRSSSSRAKKVPQPYAGDTAARAAAAVTAAPQGLTSMSVSHDAAGASGPPKPMQEPPRHTAATKAPPSPTAARLAAAGLPASAGSRAVAAGDWDVTTPTKKTVRRHSSSVSTDTLLRTPPTRPLNYEQLQAAAALGVSSALMQEGMGFDLHFLNNSPTYGGTAARAATGGHDTGAGSSSPNCLVGTPRPTGVQNLLLGWSPLPGLLQLQQQSPATGHRSFLSPAAQRTAPAHNQDGAAQHRPAAAGSAAPRSGIGMLSPGALINNPLLDQSAGRCWCLLGQISSAPPASPARLAAAPAPAAAAEVGAETGRMAVAAATGESSRGAPCAAAATATLAPMTADRPGSPGPSASAAPTAATSTDHGSLAASEHAKGTIAKKEGAVPAPADDLTPDPTGTTVEEAPAVEADIDADAGSAQNAATVAQQPTRRTSSTHSTDQQAAATPQPATDKPDFNSAAVVVTRAAVEAHAPARLAVGATFADACPAPTTCLAAAAGIASASNTAAQTSCAQVRITRSMQAAQQQAQNPHSTAEQATPARTESAVTGADHASKAKADALGRSPAALSVAATAAGSDAPPTSTTHTMQPPAQLPSAAKLRQSLAAATSRTEAATAAPARHSHAHSKLAAAFAAAHDATACAHEPTAANHLADSFADASTYASTAGTDAAAGTETGAAATGTDPAGAPAMQQLHASVCASPVLATLAARTGVAESAPAGAAVSTGKGSLKHPRAPLSAGTSSRNLRRRSMLAFGAVTAPSGLPVAAAAAQQDAQGPMHEPHRHDSYKQQAQDSNPPGSSSAAGEASNSEAVVATPVQGPAGGNRSAAAQAAGVPGQAAGSSVAAAHTAACTASAAAGILLSPCMATPAVTARTLLPAPDAAEAAHSLQYAPDCSHPLAAAAAGRSGAGQGSSVDQHTQVSDTAAAAAAAGATSGPTAARCVQLDDIHFPTLFFDPEEPHTLRVRPRRAAARDAEKRMREQQQQVPAGKGKQAQPEAANTGAGAAAAAVTAAAAKTLRSGRASKKQRSKQDCLEKPGNKLATPSAAATPPQRRTPKRKAAVATPAAAAAAVTRPAVCKRTCLRNKSPQAAEEEEEAAAAVAAAAADSDDTVSLVSSSRCGSDSEGDSDWAASDGEVSSDGRDGIELEQEYIPHSLDLLVAAAAAAAAAAAGGRSNGRDAAGRAVQGAAAGAAGSGAAAAAAAGDEGGGSALVGLNVRTQPRKSGPKGGRPQGSGNRIQMTPKGNNFGCRSARFTGVYRAQRVTLRWRTQFSYARKVLNVGCFSTEEDAARAWNAAAMHFRGGTCWVNPVKPVLPEDEGLAVAASLPQPEGGSLLPALIALRAVE